MELITQEKLNAIKPFINRNNVLKSMSESIGFLASSLCSQINNDTGDLVSSRVGVMLQTVNSSFPNILDYFNGNGAIARYLKEYQAIGILLADAVADNYKYTVFLEEINSKFNYEPRTDLTEQEYVNVCQILSEFVVNFNNGVFGIEDFIPIGINDTITKSGLYLYPDNSKVANLVFNLNGLTFTVLLSSDTQLNIFCYHPWEDVNLPIHNVCYFKGMRDAVTFETINIIKSLIDDVEKASSIIDDIVKPEISE